MFSEEICEMFKNVYFEEQLRTSASKSYSKMKTLPENLKLLVSLTVKWAKVFKNGERKICRRQLLKYLSYMVCLIRPYHLQFCKGCLPQILLGPFLNILTQMKVLYFFAKLHVNDLVFGKTH